MKTWLIALMLSATACMAGLVYFVEVYMQAACVNNNGQWQGIFSGCSGGGHMDEASLFSPLAIAIFLGIVLGVSAALVQCYNIFKHFLKQQKA